MFRLVAPMPVSNMCVYRHLNESVRAQSFKDKKLLEPCPITSSCKMVRRLIRKMQHSCGVENTSKLPGKC